MKKLLTASALIVSIALSPAAYAHEEGKTSHKMMQSSPNAMKAPYDVQFLDTMAEHHREGIEMFKMGAEKAQSQELKEKSQKMIDAQTKEIPELKAMRNAINADAPEAINRKLPGMMAMDMGKLESATGMDFDHHFIDMTIKHHQGALDMSRDALKRAKSQDVKDHAQMIIDMQTKEIAEMKQMLKTMK